jgi:hypothetical protein
VPDVQNLAANINMRATFIAGGPGIAKATTTARTIDLAPTLAYILGIPEPQQSQGRVLTEILKGGSSIKPISIVGLTDFHGQLEQSTLNTFDNAINVPVGGAAALATMSTKSSPGCPARACSWPPVTTWVRRPANSGLLQDKPAIDVENAWGLDATSLGNHEFDFGVPRLKDHVARAHFPFLATNVVETATGQIPDYLQPSKVFTINGIQVGVIGAELESTPELVSANATTGLSFLDEATRIHAESERLKALGVNVQVVVIHQGATVGLNPIGNAAGVAWDGPILGIADALQDTTIDMMFVGHTHRISNFVRGRLPIVEGFNAGMSYSVAQLMVRDGDVVWAGGRDPRREEPRRRPAGRRQGDRRRRERADGRAPEPGDRHPAVRHQARPDPAPRVGDGQHGGRLDAAEVPRRRGGPHELGRPASRPQLQPAERRRTAVRDHLGRSVLRPALR